MPKAEKRDRFVKIVERRMNRAIKDIRLIGNLSNRSNYDYTPEDVAKILRALRAEVEDLRLRFDAKSSSSTLFTLKNQ